MITVHGLGNAPANPIISAAIPLAISEITFRSAFSEESSLITGQELVQEYEGRAPPSNTVASRTLKILKPTFTIKSPVFGNKTVAPWGEARVGEASGNRAKFIFGAVAVGLGMMGIGALLMDAIRE